MSGEQDILKEKFQTFKKSFEKVLHEKKVLTNEHHLVKRELESVSGDKQVSFMILKFLVDRKQDFCIDSIVSTFLEMRKFGS